MDDPEDYPRHELLEFSDASQLQRPRQMQGTCFFGTTTVQDGLIQTYISVRCNGNGCSVMRSKSGPRSVPPAVVRKWMLEDGWDIDTHFKKAYCPSCRRDRRAIDARKKAKEAKKRRVVVAFQPEDQAVLDELYGELDAARSMIDEIEEKVNAKIYELLSERV